MRVLRTSWSLALRVRQLRRVGAQRAASVPTGTPAFEFVALGVSRLSSSQSDPSGSLSSVPSSVPSCVHPSSVELRTVASAVAYPRKNSPRSALVGALTKLRRAARSKMFARMSERFADPRSRPSGPSTDVRCVVASQSSSSVSKEVTQEWRSLSDVVGQVLTSVGREETAPADVQKLRAAKLN